MAVRMPPEWWVRWGRGLVERVYPVLSRVMHPGGLRLWLEGLRQRLVAEGVSPEDAAAIVTPATAQPLYVLVDTLSGEMMEAGDLSHDEAEDRNEELAGSGLAWLEFAEWPGYYRG